MVGKSNQIISSDNDHFSFRDIFINKSSLLDKDYDLIMAEEFKDYNQDNKFDDLFDFETH